MSSVDTIARNLAQQSPGQQVADVERVGTFAKMKWAAGEHATAVEAMDFAARLVTALRELGCARQVWGAPFRDQFSDGA